MHPHDQKLRMRLTLGSHKTNSNKLVGLATSTFVMVLRIRTSAAIPEARGKRSEPK